MKNAGNCEGTEQLQMLNIERQVHGIVVRSVPEYRRKRRKTMKTADFYYDLPQELIAQDPLEDRSSSRLMILNKQTGKTEHHVFREIINYLNP